MLSNLMRNAPQNHNRLSAGLESATEEQHTRALLFPYQPSTNFLSPSSPPTTPLGSPTFRIGPYDDRGGLDLDEAKDLRIIIAQDAWADQDALCLFDSSAVEKSKNEFLRTPKSPPTSPVPPTQRNFQRVPHDEAANNQTRFRSSTISVSAGNWLRQKREGESRDEAILNCMFGVTSSAKSGSSTKMHVMHAERSLSNIFDKREAQNAVPDYLQARAPLIRARTSAQITSSVRSLNPGKDVDVVLITRMFPVPFQDAGENIEKLEHQDQDQTCTTNTLPDGASPNVSGASRKTKLLEKKTPMFAVGLLLDLPHSTDHRLSVSGIRPNSRSSQTLNSAASSFGSDMQSSWSFLDGIPEAFSASQSRVALIDKQINSIVANWDVILRSLTSLERIAQGEIQRLLQQIDASLALSTVKVPKGPREQRTNQRSIYIRQPLALIREAAVTANARFITRRIAYALRVPRVMPGQGLVAGHFFDEARRLSKVCGTKQEPHFLFNLLTAFLGNHTQWLERLAPDWYRKQFQAALQPKLESNTLASRTVIVADDRTLARRLIFVLGSFLPAPDGSDAFQKFPQLSSSMPTMSQLSTSAPTFHMTRRRSLRKAINAISARDSTGSNTVLSASLSSTDSDGFSHMVPRNRPRQSLLRSNSDALSIRRFTLAHATDDEEHLRKTTMSSTALTSNPATPIPVFSTKSESYFPDSVTAESDCSVAQANLQRYLHRGSAGRRGSNSRSSTWGSLLSGVSGLWSKNNQPPSEHPAGDSPRSGVAGRQSVASIGSPTNYKVQPNKLEQMVSEVSGDRRERSRADADARNSLRSIETAGVLPPGGSPPRMRVHDKDGVVDVDIKLPSFPWDKGEGKSLSPTKHQFLLSTSTDRFPSTARFNHAIISPSPRESLVAGYLSRYAPDFVLQGVRPYQELIQDICQSMVAEFGGTETMGQPLQDGWTNICTTLVADARDFTLKRFILRRRTISRISNVGSYETSSQATDEKVKNKSSLRKFEENIIEEKVMDFDVTLTDALERVLYDGPVSTRPSQPTHSRTVSSGTAATASSTPPRMSQKTLYDSNYRYGEQSPDARRVVMDALEEVVKSVNDDLNQNQNGRDIGTEHSSKAGRAAPVAARENALREGVAQWLLNLEARVC